MVKILRKYNKYILVVGGSLLMVAFLMPQAVEQLGRSGEKKTYALMGDRKITYADIAKAEHEFRAVSHFNPLLVKQILGVENSDHWYLLSRAAERAGLVAEGAEDAREWPLLEVLIARQLAGDAARYIFQDPRMRQQYLDSARQYLPQLRDRAMRDAVIDEKSFDTAVSKARGMLRLVETFNRANVLSDRRALNAEKTRYDGAVADCLIVPAQRLSGTVAEPTDEELKAHFERFRTVKQGEGDFGIGYTLPARLKLEWLTLDKAAISAAVKIDPVEANKRWRTSRDKYKGEFGTEKNRVEEDLRAEKVGAILSDADSIIRAELRNPLRRLEADKSYKKLPADWATQRPSLENLATRVAAGIRAKHGVEAPLPTVTVKSGSWLTQEDIQKLEQVGASSVRMGTRQVPFSAAVFQLKELIPAGQSSGSDLGLQVGVTSPDVIPTTPAGDRIYFTVLDARGESPADTLDEVRTAAIADFKRLKAFDLLKAKADELRELAAREDLEAVAKSVEAQYPQAAESADPAAPKPPAQPLPVARNVSFTRDNVGVIDSRGRLGYADPALDVPAAREAVQAAGGKLDATKPAVETPADQRTVAVPLPRTLGLVIAQVTARKPMMRENLRTEGETLADNIRGDELREIVEANRDLYPFSLKQLVARYSYKVENQKDETKEAPEPAPAQAPFGG